MSQENRNYSKDVGDESQYFVNFLAILSQTESVDTIKTISQEAARKRLNEISEFENSWKNENRELLTISEQDATHIRNLQHENKRLLVAMFHYGVHRQIMLELSEHLIETTFPFAKKAYQNAMLDIAQSNSEKGSCYQLLNVEDRRVGLQLARAIRKGRIGLIYVDGNLGPEGAEMNEDDIVVKFFSREIKVKSGIARLAHSCDAAILPVFAGGRENPKLKFGEMIRSPRESGRKLSEEDFLQFSRLTMQKIYRDLENIVSSSPSDWEFAFCLHRWLVPIRAKNITTAIDNLDHETTIAINQQRFVPYTTSNTWYFIDVLTQKAVALPKWAAPIAQLFNNHSHSTVKEIFRVTGKEPERTRSILYELCERNILQSPSVREASAS